MALIDDEGDGRETEDGPRRLAADPADQEVDSAVPGVAQAGTTAGPASAEPPAARPGRLAALLEVVACSGFPSQVAIAGLLALAGVQPFDAAGHLSTTYVFVLSLTDAIVLVGLVVWFLRLHGERPGLVLLGHPPRLREGLLGLLQIPLLFFLVVVVMVSVRSLAPWMHNVAKNPMEGLIQSPLDAAVFILVAVVGGGVREEVQRAFILHRFDQRLGGGWLGLVLFSLVFGVGHLIQGRDVALTTAILGFFWGAIYLRRRSIASTVVSHSGFNAMEILRFAVGR